MGPDHRQLSPVALGGLGVVERLVLVVLQDRDVLVQMHQVIGRQDRDLAASAWRIDHKVGNRHAAGMALEGPDDAHAGLHRGAKMVGALGQVRLVQVVGFHPSQK